jgi:alanyl-tRNA synthetase
VTERLYLDDPWLLSFDAVLVGLGEHAGRPAAVLDRTAFYPEGGGQPADRGELAGAPVLDVQEAGGEVLHLLGGAPGARPGERVAGRVDPARRRDHVQQHHGQHLLSAAFERVRGMRTVSFHLGEATCTIDLEGPAAALDAPALRGVEAAANDLVWRDLPVAARALSPEELARLPLRKAPAKGSRVVIVSAPDPAGGPPDIVDASPCGGTHPRRTGEVGAVAVLRAQRWGAGARVEFVCGARALARLAEGEERLRAVAEALRCAPADAPAAAARLAEEAAARRKDVDRLLAALAAAEADRLVAAEGGAAVRAVTPPPAPGAPAWLRAVAQAIAARGRTAYVGAAEDGRAHACFARPKGPGPHLGEELKAALARAGGKGGGAPDLATGSAPDPSALDAVLGRSG